MITKHQTLAYETTFSNTFPDRLNICLNTYFDQSEVVLILPLPESSLLLENCIWKFMFADCVPNKRSSDFLFGIVLLLTSLQLRHICYRKSLRKIRINNIDFILLFIIPCDEDDQLWLIINYCMGNQTIEVETKFMKY